MTRIRKQLPVPACDGEEWFDRIRCNWDDCENPSSLLHKVQVCHAAPLFRHPVSQTCNVCEWKTFCSAQHLDYWAHSHLPGRYGRLSAGINAQYLLGSPGMINLDEDALQAAVDLVGRTGARAFQVGYLHDNVPIDKADWYAYAQYHGIRITEEHHRGPVEATEALARRLLTGAKCLDCGGVVTLSDAGAVILPGQLADGSQWDAETAAAAGQCRWTRTGATWVKACQQQPGG